MEKLIEFYPSEYTTVAEVAKEMGVKIQNIAYYVNRYKHIRRVVDKRLNIQIYNRDDLMYMINTRGRK